jgi:hypothetical protein
VHAHTLDSRFLNKALMNSKSLVQISIKIRIRAFKKASLFSLIVQHILPVSCSIAHSKMHLPCFGLCSEHNVLKNSEKYWVNFQQAANHQAKCEHNGDDDEVFS